MPTGEQAPSTRSARCASSKPRRTWSPRTALLAAALLVAVTGCAHRTTNEQTPNKPTGSVHGTIVQAGGPAGAQPQPTSGTVTASRNAKRAGRQTVAAGKQFSFALPEGTYTLSVTGAALPCADATVAVTAATDQTVTLVCPIK